MPADTNKSTIYTNTTVNGAAATTGAKVPAGFLLDPGPENRDEKFQVQPDGSYKLILSPNPEKKDMGLGCRLKSTEAFSAGKFCADIKAIQTIADGAVFAFYLASRNPGDDGRVADWDEVDFEFLAKADKQGVVQTNYFHKQGTGSTNEAGDHGEYHPHQSADWSNYCIDWSGSTASFSINGKEVSRTKKADISPETWMPMYGYVSIWGIDLPDWSGRISTLQSDVQAYIKNIKFEKK